ncbi:NAD(P)/FAD-dependent oxidoreductase, partial [Dryocola clanedunensis]
MTTAGETHAPSWYADSVADAPLREPLAGDLHADVCVLGAGYTGLSAALTLAERGYRVVLLEAHRVGWGASGRNGGQAIVGYGCEVDTLEHLVGAEDARALFEFSRDGMRLLRDRIARHQIDCDWRDGHASVPI